MFKFKNKNKLTNSILLENNRKPKMFYFQGKKKEHVGLKYAQS